MQMALKRCRCMLNDPDRFSAGQGLTEQSHLLMNNRPACNVAYCVYSKVAWFSLHGTQLTISKSLLSVSPVLPVLGNPHPAASVASVVVAAAMTASLAVYELFKRNPWCQVGFRPRFLKQDVCVSGCSCGRQIGLFSWGNKSMPGIADLHMPDGVHHPRPQLWVTDIAVSKQE